MTTTVGKEDVNDDHPSDLEIFDAIRSSGYLMEQEIATRLESLGFVVQPNYPFKDEETSREIDVLATKEITATVGNIKVRASIICECKNNKNYFIFFGRYKNAQDSHIISDELVFPNGYYPRLDSSGNMIDQKPALHYLGLIRNHYYYKQNFKVTQLCKIIHNGDGRRKAGKGKDDKGMEWIATHDQFYSELFMPVVKALNYQKGKAFEQMYSNKAGKEIHLFFPIVVLNDDLFFLNTQDEPLKLEKVNYASFIRQLDSNMLSGVYRVDFINSKYLEEFVNTKIKPFIDAVIDIAVKSPHLFYMGTLNDIENPALVHSFYQKFDNGDSK